MRCRSLSIVLWSAAWAFTLWGCDRSPTTVDADRTTKPQFTHGHQPPYTLPIQVNNYHLYLTEGAWFSGERPLKDGSYKGSRVLYGGSLAYGNSETSVFYYNPALTGHSFKGTWPSDQGLLYDELAPGPYADHQTVTVLLEAVDDQSQTRVPLGLVTVRETFANAAPPDDDYIILKYTLRNFTSKDVTGLHIGQVLDIDAGSNAGDDWVQYDAANQLAFVTSATPDVASGQQVLAGSVTTYRHWRAGQDPWYLANWYARLSAGMGSTSAWGPFDVRHVLTGGPVTIPAGGSTVMAFALVAGDDEADLRANAGAAKAKWTALPAAARGPYTTPLTDMSVDPRVLNLAAPGMFSIVFEFATAADAARAVGVACSGASPFRANEIKGPLVRAFFHTADLSARLRPGEPIVCDGRFSDGTRFLGADDPKLMRTIVPAIRLTFDPASDVDPSWSPDGKSIVFASDRGRDPEDFAIWRMDLAAGEASAVQVTAYSGKEPDWSPDGSTIVFADATIYGVPAAGGTPTALTLAPSHSWYPRYSPDGTEIVFRRHVPPGEPEIWKMTAAGEVTGPPAVRLAFEGQYEDQPAWSPDGELIYFVSGDPRPGGFGIYTVPASSGEPATRVTPDESYWAHYQEPAPSPDGRTLAFLSAGTGAVHIILQDLRTGTHSAVLTDPTLNVWPFGNLEYSPDGRRLLFASGGDIYVVDVSRL